MKIQWTITEWKSCKYLNQERKLGRKRITRSSCKEEIRILLHLPDDWPRQLSYPGRQNYFFLSSNVSNGCRPQFHLELLLLQIASSASLYFPRVFIFQGIPRLMISSSFPVSSVLYYLFSFSSRFFLSPPSWFVVTILGYRLL